MMLDEKRGFEILSSLRVIGDPEYGGTGSITENILVGYIYGILSEKSNAVIRVETSLFIKHHSVFMLELN